MVINTVTVDTPTGWNHDRLVIYAQGAGTYSLRVEFDNGITMTTYSVNGEAMIDVSRIFETQIDNINSATIYVTLGGVEAHETWYPGNIRHGRSWAHRAHSALDYVYQHPSSGGVDLFFGAWDSYYDETAETWVTGLSGIVTVDATAYANDNIIHLGSGIVPEPRFQPRTNTDVWYGLPTEVSEGVWMWSIIDGCGEPKYVYTDTNDPQANETFYYENPDLSGFQRLVRAVDQWSSVTYTDEGDIIDYHYKHYHDITVLPAPCYKRMAYLTYADSDGAQRGIPVNIIEISAANANGDLYHSRYSDYTPLFLANGDIGSVVRGSAVKQEFVTVGIENAVKGMRLSDIIMSDYVELWIAMQDCDSNWQPLQHVQVVDTEFVEPMEPTDVTFKLRLI